MMYSTGQAENIAGLPGREKVTVWAQGVARAWCVGWSRWMPASSHPQGTREKDHWGGNNLCKKVNDVKALVLLH